MRNSPRLGRTSTTYWATQPSRCAPRTTLFTRYFKPTAAEIEGQRLAHVQGGAWNLPALMEKLAEVRNAGLRLEKLLSRTIDNVIYPDDLPPHNEEMDRLLSGERRAALREERYECDQEVACALGVPERKHLDGYVLALAGVVELEVFAAHLLIMLTGLIEQWT